jgi:putative ABC transport system substrate-binding protein
MKERADALYAAGSPLINAYRDRIVSFAMKNRLPSMYDCSDAVYAGGLMSYGADLGDTYQRVASYIDKILRGANPADLPVEQPTKFELLINLKAAKRIGLTIPPNVLARADKAIK